MVEAEGFFSLSFGIKPITFLLRYTSANHYATKEKKMAFQASTFHRALQEMVVILNLLQK